MSEMDWKAATAWVDQKIRENGGTPPRRTDPLLHQARSWLERPLCWIGLHRKVGTCYRGHPLDPPVLLAMACSRCHRSLP